MGRDKFVPNREHPLPPKELARISRCVSISEMLPSFIDWEERKRIIRKYENKKLSACVNDILDEVRLYESENRRKNPGLEADNG